MRIQFGTRILGSMSSLPVTDLREQRGRRDVPRVVRILLARDGHSQRDLARYLGISAGRLSEKLSGKTRITVDDLEDWAPFFRCDPADLLADPLKLVSVPRGSTPPTPPDQGERQSEWFTADELAARRRTTANVVALKIPA